mmetsp:Transcript_23657/g.64160  ORF Transcript_23657/g.64160 Transcript_23657/m.64160 type:complete len:225 (-) Transcript_23657:2915-3589(-)
MPAHVLADDGLEVALPVLRGLAFAGDLEGQHGNEARAERAPGDVPQDDEYRAQVLHEVDRGAEKDGSAQHVDHLAKEDHAHGLESAQGERRGGAEEDEHHVEDGGELEELGDRDRLARLRLVLLCSSRRPGLALLGCARGCAAAQIAGCWHGRNRLDALGAANVARSPMLVGAPGDAPGDAEVGEQGVDGSLVPLRSHGHEEGEEQAEAVEDGKEGRRKDEKAE